jgi:pSer/pThr/pTyr-binding forkhead associated (FHA) protein
MVQLRIISGPMAGREVVARHFPFRLGREPAADLPLAAPGVWERHAQIHCCGGTSLELNSHPEAFTGLNGERVQRAILRNGDLIELGSVTLQFWLSPTRQASLWLREWLTWLALAGLFAAQVALIRWLL